MWVDEELPPLQDITNQANSDGDDYSTIPSLHLANLGDWKF
jgi:hypothetical protein